MPDKRHHRGPHPQDAEQFDPRHWPALRQAVAELSWLLSRGYAEPSALKLVGDRHNLTARQRTAVMRCACTDQALHSRLLRQLAAQDIADRPLDVDGYNLLTTIESALSGAVVLIARDTCWRDMASMHGTYRKVDETIPALRLVGQTLAQLRAGHCNWWLDKPVSNSGRLAQIIRQLAQDHGWPWTVQIVPNPDQVLAGSDRLIVTADSVVLDRCGRWFNLARQVITTHVPQANLVDLR
ncbi:MAG TPA: DUF434 domain-containing protein [Tepidisphaeraceae bacterium]|nr:DUF434 domain-containing protein [Tepidisphaeraceae bacterium]